MYHKMIAQEKSELLDVIEACKSGDRKAQHQIYKMLYGKMLGACMRYASDVDEAKDMLQDGFIKVFSNLEKYNGEGSFEGWVRRIVVNTSIDALRKRKNVRFYSLDDSEYEWLEDEGDGEIRWNQTLINETERVMKAVNALSPAYRTVFNLYVIEGYQHNEIAEMLGISTGTSKSNLAKAKMNLKNALGAFKH